MNACPPTATASQNSRAPITPRIPPTVAILADLTKKRPSPTNARLMAYPSSRCSASSSAEGSFGTQMERPPNIRQSAPRTSSRWRTNRLRGRLVSRPVTPSSEAGEPLTAAPSRPTDDWCAGGIRVRRFFRSRTITTTRPAMAPMAPRASGPSSPSKVEVCGGSRNCHPRKPPTRAPMRAPMMRVR